MSLFGYEGRQPGTVHVGIGSFCGWPGQWGTTLRKMSSHWLGPCTGCPLEWSYHWLMQQTWRFDLFSLWQDYMCISHWICRLWIVCIISPHWRFTDYICYFCFNVYLVHKKDWDGSLRNLMTDYQWAVLGWWHMMMQMVIVCRDHSVCGRGQWGMALLVTR